MFRILSIWLNVSYRILMMKKEKSKNFPFCPENKINPQDKFSVYWNEMKLNNHTQNKNLICDWTDKIIVQLQRIAETFFVELHFVPPSSTNGVAVLAVYAVFDPRSICTFY